MGSQLNKLSAGKKSKPKSFENSKRNSLANTFWSLVPEKSWLKKPEKPVPNATNKNDQSAEVSNTSTKLSWKIAFSQLKSLVRGSDTKWTILPSSKLSWTDPARPTLSTKPLPSPLSTNDLPERTLFLNFQNTNSKLFLKFFVLSSKNTKKGFNV